ncbi:MAG: hypothetical protein M0R33_18920 [Methylomonas sp.]|jgi:hypothetical protein|uniref:hypothetical protein n=1 Tax=Methylomonas sp. TaxID=418 RepID=UPI0025FCA00B|nr:hypothetical protein [Methylomonas sp.]MCK9608518.1 hypothetical protein [Methylomonas sp.]
MDISSNPNETLVTASSWQCVLESLGTRSLSRIAKTCKPFRNYAREIFERKNAAAYNKLLSDMLSCDFFDSDTRRDIPYAAARQFGKWCPERCVEFVIECVSSPALRGRRYERLAFSLLNISVVGIIVSAANSSRGFDYALRLVNGFIFNARIQSLGDDQYDFCGNFSPAETGAMLISRHITEQNACIILPWLATLAQSEHGATIAVFDEIIANAIEQENEILLDTIIAFISKLQLGEASPAMRALSPRNKEDQENPFTSSLLKCSNMKFIEKYEKFIPKAEFPTMVRDIAWECDATQLANFCHRHPSFRYMESVLFNAILDGKFETADRMIIEFDQLSTFHHDSVREKMPMYHALTKCNPPKEYINWILQKAEFSDERHLLDDASWVVFNCFDEDFTIEAIAFIKKHNLFSNPALVRQIQWHTNNIRLNYLPKIAQMLDRAIAENRGGIPI